MNNIKDKTFTFQVEGAMQAGIRLLKQYADECSVMESAEGCEVKIDLTEEQLNDAVLHGIDVLPIKIIVDGKEKPCMVFVKTIESSEGCTPSGTNGGVSIGKDYYANIKVKAIDWEDRSKVAFKTIVLNVYEKISDDVLEEYPQVVDVIVKYPELASIIAERPMLAGVIAEYPQVVNSLIDTGKRNWLVGDGASWILSDITSQTDDEYECVFKLRQPINDTIALFGAGSSWNSSDAYIMGFLANGLNCYVGGSIDIGRYIQVITNASYTLHSNTTTLTLINNENGISNSVGTGRTSLVSGINKFPIFRGKSGTSNLEGIRNHAISRLCQHRQGNLLHDVVPFVHNGNPCMVDLITGNIHENQGTGSFTIVTEDK